MTDEQIKQMTNRFLQWKLPVDTICPDNGISVKNPYDDNEFNRQVRANWQPVGTNLLCYTEAEAMVRHMVEGL